MNKKERKELASKANKRIRENETLFTETMGRLLEDDYDYDGKAKSMFDLSRLLRVMKGYDFIKDLIGAISYKGEENVHMVDMTHPEVLKDIDEINILYERVVDDKLEVIDVEYNKRRNIIINTFRSFEYNLRHYFDTVDTILNALVTNYQYVNSYNDTLKECVRQNILTSKELRLLRLLGQTRNMFLHNDPNAVMFALLQEKGHVEIKAILYASFEVVNKLVKENYLRLSYYALTYQFSKRPDCKETKSLLYSFYNKLVAAEEGKKRKIKLDFIDLEELDRYTPGPDFNIKLTNKILTSYKSNTIKTIDEAVAHVTNVVRDYDVYVSIEVINSIASLLYLTTNTDKNKDKEIVKLMGDISIKVDINKLTK